jgi:SAM-dependent methyltransferase
MTDLEPPLPVQEIFGQVDIYVFDQILRGNLRADMRIVDAGCGFGRNLVWLLREGAEIFACDLNPEGIDHVRALAAELQPGLPAENFQTSAIEAMPFPDDFADAVLCNSVLHFARDEQHFLAMIEELWRVLRVGGLLFVRLGSRIGMDFEHVGGHHYRIGDGSIWFLVDEAVLLRMTDQMNAVMVDPLKTTVVQDHRSMTTWVLRKRG